MMERIRKELLPPAMSAGRAALGPMLIVGERCNWSGLALASLVVTALLSDIVDGVLARRWHCDTAAVRLLDTAADTAFYACAAIALWIGQPQIWHENAALLAAVVLAEVANQGFSYANFGKPASYHSYLAKSCGLVLATAVTAAFATGHSNALVPIALVLGVACNAEGIAMSLMLPTWHRDVKTLAAAWRLRNGRANRSCFAARSKTASAAAPLLLVGSLCLMLPRTAIAEAEMPAAYAGGTAAVALDSVGALNLSSLTALTFKTKTAATPEISIAWTDIRRFESRQDVVRHLGVLPAQGTNNHFDPTTSRVCSSCLTHNRQASFELC